MKYQLGIVRFFKKQNFNEEHVYLLYSSILWDFSLLLIIDLRAEKIIDILSGREKESRRKIWKFKSDIETTKVFRKLHHPDPSINDALEICEKYSTDNIQHQMDIQLMRIHIKSTLEGLNIIEDKLGLAEDKIYERIKQSLSIKDESQAMCGICDDIDNMRLENYYNLDLNENQKIYGLVCAHHPEAVKILKRLREEGLNLIDVPKKRFEKSTLIFVTKVNHRISNEVNGY